MIEIGIDETFIITAPEGHYLRKITRDNLSDKLRLEEE